jgi:hypothetical protein
LNKAVDLRLAAAREKTVTWRLTRLYHATSLAMFMLLPLRLADTRLAWGTHVTSSECGYAIQVETSKTGQSISGPLPAFLTTFLDELLLNGLDRCFLDECREQAVVEERPLFPKGGEAEVFAGYVSHVWRTHFGTGVHIARTMVHTHFGQLGPEGVATALTLCAQRDPRTAAYYQGKAMADALLVLGSRSLIEDLTQEEVAQFFPDIDLFTGL